MLLTLLPFLVVVLVLLYRIHRLKRRIALLKRLGAA